MAWTWTPPLLLPFLFASLLLGCHGQEDDKVYIVYMGDRPREAVSVASSHHGMLQEVLGSGRATESLVYSYRRSFNGFAARMSAEEAQEFAGMESVVSVIPNTKLKLHTTRSWDFMGLTQNLSLHYPPHQGDVIIGLLDTGIWPESKSFDDTDLGPPPPKWRGICQTTNITCNNKLIGARYYKSDGQFEEGEIKSPRDSEGHGTHTSSTIAGRAVQNSSFFGLAQGTARGAVPGARIAMYKVCWSFGCDTADILAGFDDAIADGVDILSVSLGGSGFQDYFEDPVAIGAFHAMRKGILTSNSAGNSGSDRSSVSNHSPWSLTVAASSIDRKFVSQVVLGNGLAIAGRSINTFALNGSYFPLIYGGDAANVSAGYSSDDSRFCNTEYLNKDAVQGKIVLCDGSQDSTGVNNAGGLGIVMSDDRRLDLSFSYPVPATKISTDDGKRVLDYIHSTDNPIGTIVVGEAWKDVMAPTVVSFSSRGPNPIAPDVLKPDLTAPGVDILAAWTPIAPPTSGDDPRRVNFNIISGTSMSCPHVSGAAAYLKAAYPDWSPAAIKSALMTTAYVMDSRKNEDAEFAYGSGHINPIQALHPGLVFDATEKDYIDFLCNQGYNTTTLRMVTGDKSSTCPSTAPSMRNAWDLNYPSFAVAVPDGQSIYASFFRTVTNVGLPSSTYYAKVYAPDFLTVVVEPSVLHFSSMGAKESFTVKVSGGKISQQPVVSASITWSDGVHEVRTPLVAYTVLPPAPETKKEAEHYYHEGLPVSGGKLRN